MSEEDHQHPLPLMRPMPKATEVPLGDLGPLIEPIKAITTLTQAPEALALQGLLTAISVGAQSHANAETLFGTAPLSLFMFSVAESSARKSSVDGLAMKAIREYEKPLLARYARELALFEEHRSSNGRCRVDDMVIETEDHVLTEIPRTQPISPKIVFDDMTYEGLVQHLRFGQPSISLASDEGGKIVGGHAMSSGNDLAFAAAFSNLWDGKDINKVRSGTGSINLPGRRLALHMSIQPLVAQRLFANNELRDQGILSRVLVAMPDSLKGTRFLREDEETLSARHRAKESLNKFGEKIVGLLSRQPAVSKYDPLELTPRTLMLEATTRTRLVNFYNAVEAQQIDGGLYEKVSGFAGKAAEQAARIAGNLAMFENPDTESIGPDHMAVAISLMGFYLDEAVRIFDTGHVPQHILEAADLWNWICNHYHGEFIDPSCIANRAPQQFRTTEKAKEMIRILVEHGYLEKSEEKRTICGRVSRMAYRIIRS